MSFKSRRDKENICCPAKDFLLLIEVNLGTVTVSMKKKTSWENHGHGRYSYNVWYFLIQVSPLLQDNKQVLSHQILSF